ncbi:toll-like receptor Tollo [Contarinia nasturtii]|uniref:toll-like receptor Tollo n=1 Tax=Contarinia nasturtii TaxID=265458 RepID=UPI0012D3BA8F|nr:toll-like receptor Tollo [Contarinia nasturtii]
MTIRITFVRLLLSLLNLVNISFAMVSNCTYLNNNTESVQITCGFIVRHAPPLFMHQSNIRELYRTPSDFDAIYPQNGCYYDLFKSALKKENKQKIKVIKGSFLCDIDDALQFENVCELDFSSISTSLQYSSYQFKNLTKLNISNNDLGSLFLWIFQNMPDLTELDASYNNINYIRGAVINQKTKLSIMNISHNELTIVDEITFIGVTKLRILDLSFNKISSLNANTFVSNVDLETLLLGNNPLNMLSCNVFVPLKKLITFDVTMNGLSVLDLSCTNCSMYASKSVSGEVDIRLSKVHELHCKKEHLNSLEQFCMSLGYGIKNEAEIFEILPSSLQTLDLFATNTTEVDCNLFSKFYDLKNLNLMSSTLKNFGPNTFVHQTKITSLLLSGNNLKSVNCTSLFKPLQSLKSLGIANTQLKNMADILESITSSILWLDLSQNYIGKIDVMTFQKFNNLQYLNLSRTNLSNFEFSTFYHQTKLQTLDLSYNYLESIDFTLFAGNFRQLRDLFLEGNNLHEINTIIPSVFPILTTLAISKNQLPCKYVVSFLNYWKHLNLIENPSNQTNVKGIDCIVASNDTSTKSKNNIIMTHSMHPHTIVKYEDSNIMKYSMLFLCAMCCVYLVVKSKVVVQIREKLAKISLENNGPHQNQHGISSSTSTFALMNDDVL